jgi:tetratricopeptide (TPR) repeat protein
MPCEAGERAAATGQNWANLGLALGALGRHRDALSAHDKALAIDLMDGESSLAVADGRLNRAECYRALGRMTYATADDRLALATYRASLGAEAPRTRRTQHGLAARSGAAGTIPIIQ